MLLAVTRMYYLESYAAAMPGSSKDHHQGFTYKVGAQGTVLFTLANGGLIRDTGDQVFSSAYDATVRQIGLRLGECPENCVNALG